jgi:hypothetical protein
VTQPTFLIASLLALVGFQSSNQLCAVGIAERYVLFWEISCEDELKNAREDCDEAFDDEDSSFSSSSSSSSSSKFLLTLR